MLLILHLGFCCWRYFSVFFFLVVPAPTGRAFGEGGEFPFCTLQSIIANPVLPFFICRLKLNVYVFLILYYPKSNTNTHNTYPIAKHTVTRQIN